MTRILTGIQPSGSLHLGNYFGAIRPAVELQSTGQAIYFIADYHSMTTLVDGPERRKNTHSVALDWLACGLDPQKSVFFRQSDVPEVCELSWMIGTLTPMGLLERATSYKDKVAKGISPNFGLFSYPVLMAADILLYQTDVVPVGRDQKQHVEIARDIAGKFNQTYGETFVLPTPRIQDEVATVPGIDGQKMSKSYDNTIEMFVDAEALRKRVMSIKMDSRAKSDPKPDADKNIAVQLLKLLAPADAITAETRLRNGDLGYGDLKKLLFETCWNFFADFRDRRRQLEENPRYVESVLKEGAARARELARDTLKLARERSGLS